MAGGDGVVVLGAVAFNRYLSDEESKALGSALEEVRANAEDHGAMLERWRIIAALRNVTNPSAGSPAWVADWIQSGGHLAIRGEAEG